MKTTTIRVSPELASLVTELGGGHPSVWIRDAAVNWGRLVKLAKQKRLGSDVARLVAELVSLIGESNGDSE